MQFPYRSLIFDVDGTLIDSGDGITKSVQYALGKMGQPVPTQDELRCFIGPPLHESFQKFSGLSDADAWTATHIYRERYETLGVREAAPYPGIPQLLGDLRRAGFGLYVATSKPEPLAKMFVHLHGLDVYFDLICGAMDVVRETKDAVIAYLLPQMPDGGKNAVMIGDRHHDIDGAKAFSLPSVGVRYGFAPAGELENAGADYIVDTVEDLRRLLLGE